MAATELVTKNGAITFGSILCDFASFDIESNTAIDNVTPYGTNICTRNASSQTPDFTYNIGAFLQAHGTGSPPNVGVIGTTTTNIHVGTQAMTLTLDTGVSEAASVLVGRTRISHARMRGYVPFSIQAKNVAECVEVWATT